MTEARDNQPIAATPGFHPKPGDEPDLTTPNTVPATPGFHSSPDWTPAEIPVPPEPPKSNPDLDLGDLDSADHRDQEQAKDKFFPSAVQDKLQSYTKKGKGAFQKGRDQVKGAKEKLIQARNKAQEEAPKAPATSIGTLVSNLSDQIHKLIVCEIELAKVKGQEMAKRAGIGIAMLVIAAILALYMLGFLFSAAASALALVLPEWAAKLIVAGVLLLLVLMFALVGKSSLSKSMKSVPAPQEGVKQGVEAVKKGL